jgi:hypothetical protein
MVSIQCLKLLTLNLLDKPTHVSGSRLAVSGCWRASILRNSISVELVGNIGDKGIHPKDKG